MFGTIRRCALAGLCLTVLLGNISSTAEDWPNWRGPNHNGISGESGWMATWPQDGPKVPWKTSIGTGFASMAISNDRVYATGNIDDRDIVYCLDVNTGKEIWKQSYPCPLFDKNHEGGPAATPTIIDDTVYVFSKNGDAVCLNADSGKVIWHKNLPKELGVKHPTWYFASSPLVIDNMVILNAGTAGVALSRKDGSVIWQNGKGPAGYATAVPFTAAGKKCVVILGSREVLALVAATGEVLWRYEWKTSYDVNAADPILVDDTVFISSGYNKGCALLKISADGVTEVWKNKNMRNHFNSCVLWDGYIYGFDENMLRCLDFKTGQIKWSQSGLGKGSLMLAGGKLIILSERGKLVTAEASPEKFEELSSTQILTGKCWTVPAIANGRIYARNADGDLVCVYVRKEG